MAVVKGVSRSLIASFFFIFISLPSPGWSRPLVEINSLWDMVCYLATHCPTRDEGSIFDEDGSTYVVWSLVNEVTLSQAKTLREKLLEAFSMPSKDYPNDVLKSITLTDQKKFVFEIKPKVDLFWILSNMNLTWVDELYASSPKLFPAHSSESSSVLFDHVVLNLRNPMMGDHRVREALARAIERSDLQQAVSTPTHMAEGPFPPRNWQETSPPKDFRREDISKILDDSGWRLDPSTSVRTRHQSLLQFEMVVVQHPYSMKLAERIRSQWKSFGIQVTLVPIDVTSFQRLVGQRRFRDMAFVSLRLNPDRPLYPFFHSSEIPGYSNNYRGLNLSGWAHPRVDAIVSELRAMPSAATRTSLQTELQQWIQTEVPLIPLFFRSQSAPQKIVSSTDLQNLSKKG